jgi:mannosyl-oligosaccharide alpha-1,2-mannosidase
VKRGGGKEKAGYLSPQLPPQNLLWILSINTWLESDLFWKASLEAKESPYAALSSHLSRLLNQFVAMFRFRRYRLFLLAAVLAITTVYQLTRRRNWDVPTVGEGVEALRKFGFKDAGPAPTSLPVPLFTSSTTLPVEGADPTFIPGTLAISKTTSSSTRPILQDLSPSSSASTSLQTRSSSPTSTTQSRPRPTLKSRPIESDEDRLAVSPPAAEEFGQHGQGRLEVPLQGAELEKPVWVPQKEHFPVPQESLITLPTGLPRPIPRIQYDFGEEETGAKRTRRQRQAAVMDAFKHAWSGYSEYAMPHDELTPVTGHFKNPFNGWGATLVDALDTMWIMGLREEFEAAVKQVEKINFKSSLRKDIPLFETVIRYLGGLISAYDLSSGKYPILLDKALELAEILMGSFDTPNRMPVTFYYWTPSYASQPHRAGTRVVLAELGSLSVEFTRLAQITKEHKYYDAIARITNELEALQSSTSLPGLWPTVIDASGCKKLDGSAVKMTESSAEGPEKSIHEPEMLDKPTMGNTSASVTSPQDRDAKSSIHQMDKRQVDDVPFAPAGHSVPSDLEAAFKKGSPVLPDKEKQAADRPILQAEDPIDVDCEPQRLAVPPYSSQEVYSIGGQADSVYEYLPKEYMLLGGLNGQYQTMYEDAMDTVRKKLIFRPMTQDGRDILSVGRYSQRNNHVVVGTAPKPKSTLVYEGTHLTCFAGGMFAIGAKIFDIPGDLTIAKKLTDGCIWAYKSTTTGIMPETFELVPCDSPVDCTWNETKWWEALDPNRKRREDQARLLREHGKAEEKATVQQAVPTSSTTSETPNLSDDAEEKVLPNRFGSRPALGTADKLPKRQVDDSAAFGDKSDALGIAPGTPTKTTVEETVPDAAPADRPPVFTPPAPLTHEEFVQARIHEERLPPGFTRITSRKYILRPEAIESVFIMYRITGDEYWREKGWKMFTAIQSYTLTEIANSAISDVTSAVPVFADTMESFWLAETLKYFYLLYSDPSLISLDDYIL